MIARLTGDTVRTVYLTAREDALADTLAVDADLRDSGLGRYLAPGSDFRGPLLDSLAAEGET